MIDWLHTLDISLFHFVNSSLGNPFFDKLMPFVSDSPLFTCLLVVVAAVLACRGGARGRVFVFMLVLTLCVGNWLIAGSIKNAIARPRPFLSLTDDIVRVGKGGSYSMPSSHAANWFSIAMVFLIYYRRIGWALLPMAGLVAFSRVYNGVHYPSDVLAGACLGAGYSVAIVWLCDDLWQSIGPTWFPLWKEQLPSLIRPVARTPGPASDENQGFRDTQWLRMGYLVAAVLMLARLAYLASGKIELSEDEAYQWLWSKHLALSYYSKPLLIACAQFLGTHLWGDNEFGVRFFSPVITFVMSVMLLRFVTRTVNGRTAFVLLLAMTACPLLSLGSIVMTVDPWSVLFWTAAMIAGWRAAGPQGTTRDWLWVGLWMGLGLLSKYTNLIQFVCWAVFFLLWPQARVHLRRPGPWLAVAIVLICSLPIVIWNTQRGWITVAHVASDAQIGEKWHRTFTTEFLLTQVGILNPVFFIAALWAAIGMWRGGRRDPLQLYLFSMGAPEFLIYFGWSFHSRVEPNWIAPSIVPSFCLMAVYWAARWRQPAPMLRGLTGLGIGLGIFAVVLAHDTNLIGKLIHRRLPPSLDVLRRASGWKETARLVDAARTQAGADFIVCQHYGMTSEISFYLPEAKRRVKEDPMVYYHVTPSPENQFYFWPNYLGRAGQDAIFVREASRPKLRPDWFSRWWRRDADLYLPEPASAQPAPPDIQREFEFIEPLGVKDVMANGEVVRRVEIFDCRHLRGKP